MDYLKKLDESIRSSKKYRALVICILLWFVFILGIAISSSIKHEVKLYNLNALILILFGVPLVISSVVYIFMLLGKKFFKYFLVAIGVLAVVIGIAIAVDRYNQLEQRRLKEESTAKLLEKRAERKAIQDADDLKTHGNACETECILKKNTSKNCISSCAESKGDSIRRKKWKEEGASCDVQCAADPNEYCDIACELYY